VTSKPWYETDSELYASLRREVEEAYPELKFGIRDGAVFVTGYYPLFEGERVYDRYSVEIELSKESVRGLPIVREISKRIPRSPSRHINPDGTACIMLPDAFWHENPDGMSLLEFLNGPLRGYFVSQSLVELGASDPWPSGEWKHGTYGIIDFYAEVLETRNPEAIYEYLRVLKSSVVKGHWQCPCGSGERLRQCHHVSLIEQLRSRIPRKLLARSAEILFKHIRNEKRR
jgi:hypothetical protein